MGLIGDIGSAASGVLGFIGQAISNRAQAKENEKNRQFAREMWNAENEYNLPVNQLKRYTDAGLNANLIYSNGSPTLSATAQTPSTNNTFKNPAESLQGAIGSFLQSQQVQQLERQTTSNIQVNDSVINKNNAEAFKANQEGKRKEIENTYADANEIIDLLNKNKDFEAKSIANAFAKEANPKQLAILDTTLANAVKDGKIKEEQANLIRQEVKTEEERTRTQEATTGLVKEETKTQQTQQALNIAAANKAREEAIAARKQGNMYDAMAASNYASAQYTKALAGLVPAQKAEIYSKVANNFADVMKKSTEVKFTEKEIWKMTKDIELAAQKNNLEVFKAAVSSKYSGSQVAFIFNALNDSFNTVLYQFDKGYSQPYYVQPK